MGHAPSNTKALEARAQAIGELDHRRANVCFGTKRDQKDGALVCIRGLAAASAAAVWVGVCWSVWVQGWA